MGKEFVEDDTVVFKFNWPRNESVVSIENL